ncbi:MAG: hypothetical protein M3298_05170 [Thermoproteota archaeon]|nr:hypothetical protein [Thermoproteota archaeon]
MQKKILIVSCRVQYPEIEAKLPMKSMMAPIDFESIDLELQEMSGLETRSLKFTYQIR